MLYALACMENDKYETSCCYAHFLNEEKTKSKAGEKKNSEINTKGKMPGTNSQ